ncbi:ATP phosphoribosyltransferase regulatory subunit [Clostridium sp. MD294]|uniref:ATP phosphoribosyltransferase regulatory subunit n=1 Tax=Clostridium sp. MD294 TaxID=97138 RepID=UPI0002C9B7A1|nr:ATP phosphoribosyltransferase regulatory subunit [Clostridium sp. MD294]NDO47617.1 ATP phosphoribosyltransferase regulatory subunit [Clostridium sp. MD294]USF30065.1 ATP phosphoribosyltransferase regulatory subunit [Clostridium sp. MD294]
MRDNKLYTPVGVKDMLFKECDIKRNVTHKIGEIFRRFGYEQVETPTFEYMEVFSDEKLGGTKPKEMFRFFDRDGSTLALRTDMTPPIARIASTNFADKKEEAMRFSYFGNTFRYNEQYQGKQREFYQAGVELLGIDNADADGEVLAVAINSLLEAGLSDFRIIVGNVAFFKGILQETLLSEQICKELQMRVAYRDYVSVEEIVTKYDMPENSRQLFIELPKLVGTLEVLAYAKRLTKNKMAKRAISRLQELYHILRYYNMEEYVTFDLGMVGQLNYYTGIIFRGYVDNSGYSILSGGRYDNLVAQYGTDMPAVGMVLKLNEILFAMQKQCVVIEEKKAKTLVAFSEQGRQTAIQIANTYRRSGMYVEMSLLGEDVAKNMAYAQSKQMSHVLYFVDSDIVKVISLADEIGGFTVEIAVSELILPNVKEEQQ